MIILGILLGILVALCKPKRRARRTDIQGLEDTDEFYG